MDLRAALTQHWPLYGLEVRTPRLTLRYPDDHDLLALVALTADIHDPDFLPFAVGWSMLPDGERERNFLQYHWMRRGTWKPEEWFCDLACVVDGEVVGVQGIGATGFPTGRWFGTGSWLGRSFQGRGYGSEMRAAILHLGFTGLGAVRAETGAVEGNDASVRVTTKLGYQPNGTVLHAEAEGSRLELKFVLERADWEPTRRDDIELVGLDPCLPLFGLGTPEGDAIP
jgi:RimJ/RimL family protein N-acetyltransferase